jgi:hypothetical protein
LGGVVERLDSMLLMLAPDSDGEGGLALTVSSVTYAPGSEENELWRICRSEPIESGPVMEDMEDDKNAGGAPVVFLLRRSSSSPS